MQHVQMLRHISLCGHILAFLVVNCTADAFNTADVFSASQFREAVRAGIKHIVIKEHLDMIDTPAFSHSTADGAWLINIVPNAENQYTSTIRVCHMCTCRCLERRVAGRQCSLIAS